MTFKMFAATAALLLAGCATTNAPAPSGAVDVKIIAFNDFHGQLEPPKLSVDASLPDGSKAAIPVGGAAYFASAVKALKAQNSNNVVVAAGDLISASPLVSSLFLDEPTVNAMNMIGLDLNSVGNHEFDRGPRELLRMQNGGCEKYTERQPCRVEPFEGAKFGFLAANVVTKTGETLFPAYSIKSFGKGDAQVRIGFIGMTLEATNTLVIPTAVADLQFKDEAETANALIPKLKAEGVDAIVLVIHEGGRVDQGFNGEGCDGLSGSILGIIERLDPAIELVLSGHTHNAYVCQVSRGPDKAPLLLTSAGKAGTLITDVSLSIDPGKGILAKKALNIPVQSAPYEAAGKSVTGSDAYTRFEAEPTVAALVQRYAAAAQEESKRVVGRLAAPITEDNSPSGEHAIGNFIADAQLFSAAPADKGGAQISFTNGSGIRADLNPAADGSITFGDIYAAQPFGNELVVKTMTGAQIRRLLEQQFTLSAGTMVLSPSAGFHFAYDLRRPAGQRVVTVTLDGKPIEDARSYRVVTNSFLTAGGDGFTVFAEGTEPTTVMSDIASTEDYLAARAPVAPPALDRVTRLDPVNK